MAWSVNEFLMEMVVRFDHRLQGLDPEKWRDNKRDLDYTETPFKPDPVEHLDITPLGLGIWFEMLRIFLLILLVIGLIYLVYRIARGAKRGKRVQDEESILASGPVTALSTLDALWEGYRLALNESAFKEAIRILYQITLKKLGDKGLVRTKAEKTNREYMNELRGNTLGTDFTKLTSIHEFCWYGDTEVNQRQFSKIEPAFMAFINSPQLEK